MSGIATAIAGAAVIGVGAAAYSSHKQGEAADKATEASSAAAANSAAAQLLMFNTARADYAPFQKTGVTAIPGLENFKTSADSGKYLNQLKNFNPLNETKFDSNDPIYKWRMKKAEEASNRAFSSRGMYNSRPAVNSLMDVSMGLSGQESDKQYQRSLDEYKRLAGIYDIYSGLDTGRYNRLLDRTKIGAGAAGSAGSSAMQTGNSLASIYGNLGNNLSANYMQQGENQANFYSGLGALPLNALNAYSMYQQPAGVNYGGSSGAGGSASPYYDATTSYGGYTPRY